MVLFLGFFVLVIFFILSMSLATYLIERSQLRAAVNEAVRAGEPFGNGVAECNARFEEFRQSLDLFDGLTAPGAVCTLDTDRDQLVATAGGTFTFWAFTPIPDVSVEVTARAYKDHGL